MKACIVFFTLTHLLAFGAETSIAVRAHTFVSNSQDIHLGDVLIADGLSEEILKALASVKLTNGPSLGERRVLSSSSISRLLRQNLNQVQSTQNLRLMIPSQVIVENRGYQLEAHQIEKAIKENWKSYCSDCEYLITSLSLPKIQGQVKPLKWKINFDSRPPRGQFSFPMQVDSESGIQQNVWVQGLVKVQKRVPVATRAIHFGEKLTANDIEMKLQDITFSHDSPAMLESALDHRVRRALRAGDIIWTNTLEKKMAARRGQTVKMVIGSEEWLLSMPGVAQMDGQVGDVISVKNAKTNKIVSAKITSENEVRVQ